jgi:hypothetical protein
MRWALPLRVTSALALFALSSAFLAQTARTVHSKLCATSTSPAAAAKQEGGYTHEGMPTGLDAVANQALEGLASAIDSGAKRLKIDVLLPGLNQKLESTAPSNAGLLLAFLRAMLPAFDQMQSVKVGRHLVSSEEGLICCSLLSLITRTRSSSHMIRMFERRNSLLLFLYVRATPA